jgi:Fe-S oxidoreductase
MQPNLWVKEIKLLYTCAMMLAAGEEGLCCGLAGGTWDQIETGISEEISSTGIEATVYDFD